MTDISDVRKPKIVVVEDETLIALSVASILDELGFTVIGPFRSLDQARHGLSLETCDAALLDIRLGGEAVFPLMDDLIKLQVPFAFLTGYSESQLPMAYRELPRISKPFYPTELKATLASLIDRSRSDLKEVSR